MIEQSSGCVHAASSKRGPWKAIIVAIVLIAAVVALLWFWRIGRGGGPGWQQPGAIDVVAMRVVAEPAPVRLEALGEVRAVRQVTLSSEVGGRVAVISFEPGRRVKVGAVLVRLDDAVEQADLAAARAGAVFARQQLARATELAAIGASSREVLQQREAERDRSAAAVRQLEARIGQKRIRAPFDGELGLRWVDLGQYVNAGERAVTLTDLDTLYVNFDVPQQALARLETGQTVEVRSDAPETAILKARISAIEPQVGRDTRNVTVQATLKNERRALRPGMYVTAAVVLPPEPDALLLPAAAIMTSASGDAVAVVRELSADQTGRAEIVPVTTGRRLGDRVLVTRGLQAGDVVITEGQVRLRPDVAVRVVDKATQPGDER
ncbi:MAG: efflux RND transporter periplasmic adaptor subunit [Azoarcus sp.]|jgi:multidrug efflux system membrane fusion protein|nr:efflux RND transporter periplasmic adaptor subunit [Azoarcus sp.]